MVNYGAKFAKVRKERKGSRSEVRTPLAAGGPLYYLRA